MAQLKRNRSSCLVSEPCNRADLTNCDRDAILQRAAIQPFGFLLAASPDWRIVRASANLGEFLGVDCEDILGQPLSGIIMSKTLHTIRNRLTVLRGADMVERLSGIAFAEGGPIFDVALHFSGDHVVIEAEASQAGSQGGSTISLRAMMVRLDQAQTLEAFFREGARLARGITGFDRVLVHRFDEGGAGEVVAEATRPAIGSFLGFRYPAPDIPVLARTLHLRNPYRIIADVEAAPVPILPERDEHGSAIDLSLSILRSVSPSQIEYLKNMGVAASLSIPIVTDGMLWGLFTCHHYSARLPSFERRSTVEIFAQMFASRLQTRECRLALKFETKARQIVERLFTDVAGNAGLLDDPAWLAEALAGAVPADGIGVSINGRTALTGLAPSQEQFSTLIDVLDRNAPGHVFTTDHIAEFSPGAETNGDVAGLLVIPISRLPRDYVVFFRQEILRTAHWAGDPHRPGEYGPNAESLTPRGSFNTWLELARGRARPFSKAECNIAETIRVALEAFAARQGR
ncbi:hypothetical protein CWR43_21440 [Rhizobium sullae]|uniref:Phytochrome chromophore attachment site domain-containing protein n=1 Tax=Rhizobium sullae TaxID=50338 RepID=A0A2N0D5M0_RHISU|nr:hypothetical protein CWR43_21440 [Rhizobium sullae]